MKPVFVFKTCQETNHIRKLVSEGLNASGVTTKQNTNGKSAPTIEPTDHCANSVI